LTQRNPRRRSLLGAAFALPAIVPLASCTDMAMFGQKPKYTLTPRGDRMVRWLQNEGREVMMAPDALAVMGITNEGRDIPVRLLGEYGSDGRYVIALIEIRKVWEFVLHRFQNDVFIFHNMDRNFTRLASVRYAKNGRPTFITDSAFAEADFQKQLAFWVDRMPGR
jgi:hypothetical protein